MKNNSKSLNKPFKSPERLWNTSRMNKKAPCINRAFLGQSKSRLQKQTAWNADLFFDIKQQPFYDRYFRKQERKNKGNGKNNCNIDQRL